MFEEIFTCGKATQGQWQRSSPYAAATVLGPKKLYASCLVSKAFPGPGTGPLSGPGRGFKFFPGLRVLTGPGLHI